MLDEPVLSIHIGDAFHGEERDLRRLKWVTEVPVLILQGKRVTDGWIKQAAAMPSMEELHLYQAQISDTGLTVLADDGVKDPAAAPAGPKGSKLKQIGIYYTPIGEAALAPLAKLPLLGFVKLYGTRVTKAGVEKFKATSGVADRLSPRGIFGSGRARCRWKLPHFDDTRRQSRGQSGPDAGRRDRPFWQGRRGQLQQPHRADLAMRRGR